MKRIWYWVGLAVIAPIVAGVVIAQDAAPKEAAPKAGEVREIEVIRRQPGVRGFSPARVAEWAQTQPGFHRRTIGIEHGITIDFAKEGELQKAIEEYRKAESEKDKAAASEAIKKLVSEQFDARQKARDEELKQLEANLKKLREIHSKRTSEKESIVSDRVRQLVRDSDGLGWGDDEGHGDFLITSPQGQVLVHPGPAALLQTK